MTRSQKLSFESPRHRSVRAPRTLVSLLLIAACGSPAAEPPPAPPQAADAGNPAGGQWARNALEEQPRMEALRRETPEALGYTPATTPWRILRALPAPVRDSTAAATPGEALSALASSLGWSAVLGGSVWEQVSRVWMEGEDKAVGVVLQWGFLDDAVAGRDRRVLMRRTHGSWRIESIEERFHCRRAVTAGGECA